MKLMTDGNWSFLSHIVGMISASATTPPLFQSKFLCFSVFYLFIALFLALYQSFSSTKCLFRSSPFDPVQTPLFSYPRSYGEHKYAIPTLRDSCSSPVFFSDYGTVLKEIQGLCENSSSSSISPDLRYVKREFESDAFGGNFSTQKRISFFDHSNSAGEIPCGFLKKFPISNSDRIALENCNGVVVVSAIFNDHDKIRQPRGAGSKTLEIVCFFMFVDDATFKGLDHHQLVQPNAQDHKIGIWSIIKVDSTKLYHNPAMNGVIPKYLTQRLFPNAKFSIWIDAKLRLMVDPLLLIHSLVVKEEVDMAISKHPFYVHTMEEVMATARWKKWWDVNALTLQMETYCENGLQPWSAHKLPYTTDVPDTALILRKHGTKSDLFSCLMFNELEAFNPRDQLAFAFVRDQMKAKPKMNIFKVEVFEQVVVEYRHNIKKFAGEDSQGGTKVTKPKRTKRASHELLVNSSRCQNYLLQMWGERESHK